MKLANYLKKAGCVATESDVMEGILGFEPIDVIPRNIDVYPAYAERNLTVIRWVDRESGLWGFLRDDNAGWHGWVCFNSHDDEETLAAQNADYDVTILKRRGDGIDWDYILRIAEENCWGFDGKNNIQKESGKQKEKGGTSDGK